MKNEHVPFRWAAAGLLLLALVPMSAALSAGEVSAADVHQGRIRATEAERRAKLDEAGALYEQKEYEKAVDIVTRVKGDLENDTAKIDVEVLNSLKKSAQQLEYQIRKDWALSVFRQAQEAAGDEKYEQAIDYATQAASIDNDMKSKSDRLIDNCKKNIEEVNRKKVLSIDDFAPEVKPNHKEVEQILIAAEVFLKNNEPEKALDRVEQAFIIDPTNVKATELAGRIYNSLYAYGIARRKADLEAVYAYGEWQWTEPVFPEISGSVNPKERGSIKKADGQQVLSRMDRIIIPQIEFEDADVGTVLDWISSRSLRYDPNKRGININKSFPESSDNWRVSINMRNIPMSEVIRYICQQTGLKYRIDSDSIFVGPSIDEMISRRFSVPANLIDNVASETKPSDGGSSDSSSSRDSRNGSITKGANLEITKGTGSARTITEDQWKSYFSKRGVKFPSGSGVNFTGQTNQLVVRNTPENLQQLDVLLRQLETVDNPPLIMVEIKSIEVKENDYQELGFDWAIGNGGHSGTDSYFGSSLTMHDDGSTQLDPGEKMGWLIGQGVNTFAKGVVKTLRGGNTKTDNPLSTIVDNWNIFPTLFGSQHPFGSDLPLNISLTINAMDQNTRTETLSAPKVITSNDKEAEVKLVRTYFFPESWDELEIEVDSSDDNSVMTITPPVPNFPENGTEIGINFTVKPQVLSDNRTIRMNLKPLVTTYEGDDEWPISLKFEVPDGEGEWVRDPSRDVTYIISKPIIGKREMDVWVDLDNGETVVLGGLVHSETVARVDKVPILGDLPLIGRLFQSHAETAERTNLLFFVTARLLSHDGMPIERDNIPGVPDFNR